MATTPPRTRGARGLDRRTAEVADDLDVDAVEDLRASAAAIVARLLEEPPRLGGSRLLGLDGPSGSGKTTLAAAIAEHLDAAGMPARILHLDDHYAGWDDLPATPGRVAEQVLTPLSTGRPGSHGRYDWTRGEVVEQVEVAPLADGEIVVLEGVGAGAGPIAGHRSLLVWVEASPTLCLQRAVRRDGPAAEDDLRAWARAEARHFEEQRTRGLAQLRVDAWGRLLSPAGRRGRSRR